MAHHPHDAEEPLLESGKSFAGALSTEDDLTKALDRELADIISFYYQKEAELLGKVESLDLDIHSLESVDKMAKVEAQAARALSMPTEIPLGVADFSAHDRAMSVAVMPQRSRALAPSQSQHTSVEPSVEQELSSRPLRVDYWRQPPKGWFFSTSKDRDKLRPRMQDLFVALNDLIAFLDINKEGFRKLLKKHDKVTDRQLKAAYWPVVEAKYPSKHRPILEQAVERLIDQYAVLFVGGDVNRAKDHLSRQLRDVVKMERNTVWRDMVALERRTVDAHVEQGGHGAKVSQASWFVKHHQLLSLATCVALLAAVLNVDIFPQPEKQNCLALLVFVSSMWATEAIPLYVTSMLVPVLVVLLRVLVGGTPENPHRLTAQEAAPAIFHAMFSQVIMLLLGGFAIAAALSKHFIAKQIAIAVLSRVGRQPANVLLACMFVATFMSMWISNVAAPVLCFSLIQPILRLAPPNCPFAKSLVMGIALASNVGGMSSPISSPQNIFAIETMSADGNPPSWLSWFAIALPVAVVCNIICWLLLLLVYRPWRNGHEVRPMKPNTDPTSPTQVFVIVVSLVTVGLWCANASLQSYVGEMGIIAILPLAMFFGSGILSKDDFNGFLWNVVMLAMGGLALGEAVKSSGLLLTIAQSIQVAVAEWDLWQVCAVFCCLVLVCTTFISHTVGAMIILPIVHTVGQTMPGDKHPKLLVMTAALMCSGAMGLPVSGFPNMNAVSLEDATGQNYVNTLDFVKSGVPGSLFALVVILSVGYWLALLVGF